MENTSFNRSRIKVLLLEGVHASAEAALREAGYTRIERHKAALTGQDLIDALEDVRILGIRSRTQLDAAALTATGRLMAVGCFCIGTNQVDLAAAAARGIPVFNAPFSNTRSVAELVLAEAILLLRSVPARHNRLREGIWEKSASNSFETRGKTLGIVGYGNIGGQLGVLAESLGMRVLFYDVEKKLNLGNARQVDDLSDLLGSADVVSMHVPATPATVGMLGANELARMKPSAVLINASRGNVIDLDALAAALRDGRLLGAAIDVYPEEPQSNNEPFESPLRSLDNVLLTPHIGGSTAEAQENIGEEVAAKLIRYTDNGSTLSAVNFPEVALPEHPGQHRLLHIHRNQPGVMSAVNQVFSELGVNITGQYLQTTPEVGYVVIDVDTESSAAALTALREIEGTIRSRILF
ncbi:MAG: phosphoglycerate dehydrogenase [Pseudomonadota bacterium]